MKCKIKARNVLENKAYKVKQTVNAVKNKDKIDIKEKKTILVKVDEVIGWLDDNQNASKDE